MLARPLLFCNLRVYYPSDSFKRAPEHCTWTPAASYAITCLSTTYICKLVSLSCCWLLSKLDNVHPERNCITAADASHACITRSYAVLLQQAHGPDGSEEGEMSE